MLDDGGAHGARPQSVAVRPFKCHAGRAALSFDLRSVLRLKDRPPVEARPAPVVAHVHDLLVTKALSDARRELVVELAAVGQRGLAAARRWLHTAEPNLHGPVMIERVLVVPEHLLIRRVKDWRIDFAADVLARVFAVIREES